jgi:hypothetical protein
MLPEIPTSTSHFIWGNSMVDDLGTRQRGTAVEDFLGRGRPIRDGPVQYRTGPLNTTLFFCCRLLFMHLTPNFKMYIQTRLHDLCIPKIFIFLSVLRGLWRRDQLSEPNPCFPVPLNNLPKKASVMSPCSRSRLPQPYELLT